ncbi:MAG: DegT/DnrJ/EryC1/StrS family aminotransferase [Bacteroidota bacterium]
MSKQDFIHVPYGQTVHGEEEIAAVVNVLRTSTQMGPNVREFESKISALFEKKYGLMVNSGSSANYLALEVLGLPQGAEIITPALTFSTTVAPQVKNQFVPSFIDVCEGTYNIDASAIEGMITPKTKALMIPSLIGNMPDWDCISQIARKYSLVVIEDSADTLGGTLKNKSTGSYSDISTTSFYGSHVINCAGNGGMVCFNNEEFATKAKLLRSWGRSSSLFVESEKIENRFNVNVGGIPYDAKFVFSAIGYNLEPSEVGAAFGLVQLKHLQQNIEIRNKNFTSQRQFFKTYEEYFILPKQQAESRTGWLAFPLTIRDTAPFNRREFQIFFEERNIQTRTVFTGNILRQPGFANINCVKKSSGYPNADLVMRGGVLLGCHHGLKQNQLDHIHDTFHQFLRSKGLKP